MERLSKDDMFNLAINLDLKDLLNFCKTSKRINNVLCKQDTFWLYKIKQSFPSLEFNIMNLYKGTRIWKNYYIQDLYPTINKNVDKVLIDSSGLGRLDLVIAALDLGANIHTEKDRAVRLASQNGHYKIVKFLIEREADIHALNNIALINAVANVHYEVVKLLLDSGADADPAALRNASYYGHLEIVKLLIDYGADADNDSAVRLAQQNGHYEIVKLLIEHGARDPRYGNF